MRDLKKLNWDVRIDFEALKGGREWKGVIYQWLADCDVAIILVNRAALTSMWVRREVNILLWRRACGSPLIVIPVLIGDVSIRDVQRSDLTDLTDIEVVTGKSAETLIAKIAELLPDLSGPLPQVHDMMRRWLGHVADCLREVTDEQALRATARALRADDDWHFASLPESRRFIAHQMLSPELNERIYDGIREIARPSRDYLPDLITLVTPTWVNGEASRALLPNGRQVFAVLNARWPETARYYVQRAACCSLNFRTATVTAIVGAEQRKEFLRSCEAAIYKLLGLRTAYPLDGERPREGDVGFLVVEPGDVPVDMITGALRELIARFDWLNIILLVGELAPDTATLAGWGLAGALLRPELGPDEEKRATQTVDLLRGLHEAVTGR